VKYAFVAKHRPLFSVRAMCRCLRIQPSGFYAWLKNPLSKRAREDARQAELIREAWKDSGKVYGYRKLHDELLDQGEAYCPNRVARLASLAGIKAQIGYKRRPGSYGGKPSLVIDKRPRPQTITRLSGLSSRSPQPISSISVTAKGWTYDQVFQPCGERAIWVPGKVMPDRVNPTTPGAYGLERVMGCGNRQTR
jgi:hypothetical protein